MEITLKNGKILTLPEDYRKTKLPFFDEWVAALKSGEYKQGRRSLCSDTDGDKKYCCLGVLSQIQERLLIDKDGRYTDMGAMGGLNRDNPCFSQLQHYGTFPGARCDDWGSLASINDSREFSFEDIAEVIEHIWES